MSLKPLVPSCPSLWGQSNFSKTLQHMVNTCDITIHSAWPMACQSDRGRFNPSRNEPKSQRMVSPVCPVHWVCSCLLSCVWIPQWSRKVVDAFPQPHLSVAGQCREGCPWHGTWQRGGNGGGWTPAQPGRSPWVVLKNGGPGGGHTVDLSVGNNQEKSLLKKLVN